MYDLEDEKSMDTGSFAGPPSETSLTIPEKAECFPEIKKAGRSEVEAQGKIRLTILDSIQRNLRE
jgi:hypothetical protein